MNEPTSTPVVALEFLTGNEPTSLNATQEWLMPHASLITSLWWVLWVTVIVFMVSTYIIKPLLHKA